MSQPTNTDVPDRPTDPPLRRRAGLIAGLAAVALAGGLIGALVATAGNSADVDPITIETSAERSGATAGGAPAAGAGPVAPAPAVDPDDAPIPGAERRQVEEAALRITGGGTVTEVDRSDDVGEAFEVEVVTDAGEIDVALDQNLERVPNLRYDEPDDDGS